MSLNSLCCKGQFFCPAEHQEKQIKGCSAVHIYLHTWVLKGTGHKIWVCLVLLFFSYCALQILSFFSFPFSFFLFFFFTYWRFVATLVRWWLASLSNAVFLVKMYVFCFQPSLHSDKMRCNGSILRISCSFAKSFHIHLRFKGFVNKISHSLYTNK